LQEEINIKYKHPFLKILFNYKILFLLTVVNLVILADFLEDYEFNLKLAKFFYSFFLIALVMKALLYISYFIMLLKLRNLSVTNEYLIINKEKKYRWEDIELKLSEYSEVSYSHYYAHNAVFIAIFQNDIVEEEILCYLDARDLFEIDYKDLFALLKEIQNEQKINREKYIQLVEKQKANHKKALEYLLILLSIVLLPIILIIIFIKS